MADYVNIAEGVEGFAYYDQDTNELVTLQKDSPGTAQTSLRPATREEIEGARRGFVAQGMGQKALGLAEQVAGGASFGLLSSDSPEAKARAQVLGQENPILKGVARVGGALAPAVLSGGVASAGGAALGLGRTATGLLSAGVEELAVSGALELQDAAETDRDIEVGNIAQGFLEGAAFLGGGRFLSRVGGKVAKRVLNTTDNVAGSPDQALLRARENVKKGLTPENYEETFANHVPTRKEALWYRENKDLVTSDVNNLTYQAGNRLFGQDGSAMKAHNVAYKKQDIWGKMEDADVDTVAETLDRYADQAEELATKMASPQAAKTIRQHAAKMRALAGGGEIPPVPHASPVDLTDLELEDLGALTQPESFRSGSLEGLRGSEEFKSTGRVPESFSKADHEQGIRIEVGDDGVPFLRDGRHRFTVARESGAPEVWGSVYKADDPFDPIYRGPIPINKTAQVPATGVTGDVEDMAVAVDQFKKHLDAWRDSLGQVKKTAKMTAQQNVAAIDEILEPIRKDLENSKIWGKNWSEKQKLENALWSGKEGIINSRARWQSKLMDREPGAARTYRSDFGDLPSFKMKGDDMVATVLAMGKNERKELFKALDMDIKKSNEMNKIKAQIGGPETRTAISQFAYDLANFSSAVDELKYIDRLHTKHGPLINRGTATKQFVEELLESAPLTGALSGGIAGAALGVAAKAFKRQILDSEFFTKSASEARVGFENSGYTTLSKRSFQRRAARLTGEYESTKIKGQLSGLPTTEIGQAVSKIADSSIPDTAFIAGQHVLNQQSVAAETQAIRNLDRNSQDETERAVLNLAFPDEKPVRLSPVGQRFQGEFKSLREAYDAKMADLNRLLDDPEEFIARTNEAFQPLANAGHPELASKLITRMMVGLQYLRENAPPTMGQSMFNPEGSGPDDIAILQFAPVWDAIWNPIDTVRDLSTRAATPSAIKALKEVHTDVYERVMVNIFQSLAAAGPGVDFETKRYLDNVFGMGAAVGRSFSPTMSNLLAEQRQNKQPVQNSSSNINVAPTSAVGVFGKGPTSLR